MKSNRLLKFQDADLPGARLLWIFAKGYWVLHFLSIDVVLGAIGGYAFASKALNQEVSFAFISILAFAVSCIYQADHLLDSRNASSLGSPKYWFYLNNRKPLLVLLLGFGLIGGILAWRFLSPAMVKPGVFLGSCFVLYFFAQHFLKGSIRRYFPKELLISLIYMGAVWGYPSMVSANFPKEIFMLLLGHFFVTLANVLLFTLFERSEDIAIGKTTMFSGFPERVLIAVATVCNFAGLLCGIVHLVVSNNIFLAMPLLFIPLCYFSLTLFYRTAFLKKNYPGLIDGAFLLFVLYLL